MRTLLYVAAMATGILDALGEAKAATVRIVEGANGSARCERRWHFPLPAVLRARRRPVPETALLEGVHCTVQACLLRPLRREYHKAFLERWCAGAPVQHCCNIYMCTCSATATGGHCRLSSKHYTWQ